MLLRHKNLCAFNTEATPLALSIAPLYSLSPLISRPMPKWSRCAADDDVLLLQLAVRAFDHADHIRRVQLRTPGRNSLRLQCAGYVEVRQRLACICQRLDLRECVSCTCQQFFHAAGVADAFTRKPFRLSRSGSANSSVGPTARCGCAACCWAGVIFSVPGTARGGVRPIMPIAPAAFSCFHRYRYRAHTHVAALQALWRSVVIDDDLAFQVGPGEVIDVL